MPSHIYLERKGKSLVPCISVWQRQPVQMWQLLKVRMPGDLSPATTGCGESCLYVGDWVSLLRKELKRVQRSLHEMEIMMEPLDWGTDPSAQIHSLSNAEARSSGNSTCELNKHWKWTYTYRCYCAFTTWKYSMLILFLCIHVHMCGAMYVCRCSGMCARVLFSCVCGGRSSHLVSSSIAFHLIFWDRVSHWTRGLLTWLGWLAWGFFSAFPHNTSNRPLISAEITGAHCHLQLFMGCRDPSSGLHSCPADFSDQAVLQPLEWLLNILFCSMWGVLADTFASVLLYLFKIANRGWTATLEQMWSGETISLPSKPSLARPWKTPWLLTDFPWRIQGFNMQRQSARRFAHPLNRALGMPF